MKPRRTHDSNRVFELPSENEDHHLWVTETFSSEAPATSVFISVWEPSVEERAAIARGENIELAVYGAQVPVAVQTTGVPLGRPPGAEA